MSPTHCIIINTNAAGQNTTLSKGSFVVLMRIECAKSQMTSKQIAVSLSSMM